MKDADIKLLLTHKCSLSVHQLGRRLGDALKDHGIQLLIDPFRVGDDVETRMLTFDFDALIFFCSPESIASEPCQLELRSARRQRTPMFVALLEGSVPPQLKVRLYWNPAAIDDAAFAAEASRLATAIRNRVTFSRELRLLHPENFPQETLETARKIATESDRTLVAEYAGELAKRYLAVTDASTRFWIALALGKAGTKHAAQLLDRLPKTDHPYALEGVKQALEMIRQQSLAKAPQSE